MWFAADHDTVQWEKLRAVPTSSRQPVPSDDSDPPPSWHALLGGVVLQSLLQFVYLYCEYQRFGGKLDQYDHEADGDVLNFDLLNVAHSLMKVNTDWKQGTPCLHLHDYTLEEWKTHFKEVDFAKCNVPVEIPDSEDRDLQRSIYALNTGDINEELESKETKEALEEAYQVYKQDHEEYLTLASEADPEAEFFLEADFVNLSFAHPTPVANPPWTPFMLAFAQTNIYGKLSLLYRKVDSIERHSKVVSMIFDDRARRMAKQKENLAEQIKKIKRVQCIVDKRQERDDKLNADVKKMQTQIETAKADYHIKRYLDYESMKQHGMKRAKYVFVLLNLSNYQE